MTCALSVFFGGGPGLTPEQKARLDQMERDYEQMRGQPSKPTKDGSGKYSVTKPPATCHSSAGLCT